MNNFQDKYQQTLSNINSLQIQEKGLYDSLNDASLSADQKNQIIQKINQISQMRLNLYGGMNDMYSMYAYESAGVNDALGSQLTATDILTQQLDQSDQTLKMLQDQQVNMLNATKINSYYSSQYNAHASIMKIIIITCIPMLILTILAKKKILPSNLYIVLMSIIIIISVITIGSKMVDLSNRDHMNWDEYNWYFDKSSAPDYTTIGASVSENTPSGTVFTKP
jgi:hypothetical protein